MSYKTDFNTVYHNKVNISTNKKGGAYSAPTSISGPSLKRNANRTKEKVVVMKKYTDKELAAMSQEELKALQGKAPAENKLLGQRIEKILTNVLHPTAVDGK